MISVLLLFYNLTRLLSGGLHTRHSHSPSGAVSSPLQARWSHPSHNSHWIISSQHSGLEHEQNSLMSQFCLLLNLGVALSRGKGSKRPLSKHFTKCSRIFPVQKRRTKGCFQRPARKRKRWQTGLSQPLLVVPAQEEAPQQGCYQLPSSYSIRLAELPLMT